MCDDKADRYGSLHGWRLMLLARLRSRFEEACENVGSLHPEMDAQV
jgi:hypothetical protein